MSFHLLELNQKRQLHIVMYLLSAFVFGVIRYNRYQYQWTFISRSEVQDKKNKTNYIQFIHNLCSQTTQIIHANVDKSMPMHSIVNGRYIYFIRIVSIDIFLIQSPVAHVLCISREILHSESSDQCTRLHYVMYKHQLQSKFYVHVTHH